MRKKSFIINTVFLLLFSFFSMNSVIAQFNLEAQHDAININPETSIALIFIIPAIILDFAAYKSKNKIVSVIFYVFFIGGGFIISCFAYLWGFLIILSLFAFRIYVNKKEISPQESVNNQESTNTKKTIPLWVLIVGLFASIIPGFLHFGLMPICYRVILVLSNDRGNSRSILWRSSGTYKK